MRKLYDKLVRDRIPEIIRGTGKKCGTERLEDDTVFRRALRDKLVEEATEATNAADADLATELADVLGVVDALIDTYGLSHDAVRALQQECRAMRGGFSQRLRLLRTE